MDRNQVTFTTWEVVHRYRRLVRREQAAPVKCPDCHIEFVTKIGKDDEPVFYCWRCRTVTTIGVRLMDQMRAVVNEHFGVK